MKKIILKFLLGMTFCFLYMAGNEQEVRADIIYYPEDEFIREHRDECQMEYDLYGGRQYTVTAESVGVYESPESEEPYDNVWKNKTLRIYYLYRKRTDNSLWGCVECEKWVPMENMKLVYDNREFEKDHKNEIRPYAGELDKYQLNSSIILYYYPGGGYVDDISYDPNDPMEEWLIPTGVYEDEEGKLWGYIYTYRFGRVWGWMCISTLPLKTINESGEKEEVDNTNSETDNTNSETENIEIGCGDVNSDGTTDLLDAQIVLKVALKIMNADNISEKAADMDGNSKIELTDAQIILKKVLKISE